MNNKIRYLVPFIQQDLQKKMVLLSGPRQVGKTTLSQSMTFNHDYLNFDILRDRQRILKAEFKPHSDLVIFDEIHKMKTWKNYIKGYFDDRENHNKKILVTGSAKLDIFQRGGDSLQGRYFSYRLHPLSFHELKMKSQKDIEELFELGGFPEPFYSSSQKEARRWREDYMMRLVNEEVRGLERVADISRLELLALRLPDLVGSPLSINSLREDLSGASHRGVSHWLDIFEKLYLIFRLSPLGLPKIKAVKKEQKHYFWDFRSVSDVGFRFENMIACHLLKWCHFKRDTEGYKFELSYVRDQLGREVDFAITDNKKPILFIECKFQDTTISPALSYLKSKYPQVRCVQVVMVAKNEFINQQGIELLAARTFLSEFV